MYTFTDITLTLQKLGHKTFVKNSKIAWVDSNTFVSSWTWWMDGWVAHSHSSLRKWINYPKTFHFWFYYSFSLPDILVHVEMIFLLISFSLIIFRFYRIENRLWHEICMECKNKQKKRALIEKENRNITFQIVILRLILRSKPC